MGLGRLVRYRHTSVSSRSTRRLKKPVVSVDALLQFLVDDKFGISASYYKTMQEMLKLSNSFFASSSTAMPTSSYASWRLQVRQTSLVLSTDPSTVQHSTGCSPNQDGYHQW